MVFASTSIQSTVLAAALLAATAHGHANMILPLPTWPDGFYNTNSPSGTIDGYSALTVPDGMSYDTDGASNLLAFETAFNASSYTSLKELVLATETLADGASHECGFSLTTGTARDLPEYVEWTEFTTSHIGPCEVWCDDTLAFSDHNCEADYPGSTGYLPYDQSLCEGAAMLTSRWLALHVSTWQVYTNCAPLTGSTAASSGSSTTAASSTASSSSATTTTTTAPATTTATPTVSTSTASSTASATTTTTDESEAASTADEATDESAADEETEAPTSTTATPTTTTATPTSTTAAPTTTTAPSSCRRRRN